MEFFEVNSMIEAKRNIKIVMFFVLIPCAFWWANLTSKILGYIFGRRD